MENVDVIAFNPEEVAPGDTMTVTTEEVPDVSAGSGIVKGAILTAVTGGAEYRDFVVQITDQETYAEFIVMLPTEIDDGDYNFEMYLTIGDGGAAKQYKYFGGPILSVKGGGESGTAHITSIMPREMALDDLSAATMFSIRGDGLDKLQNWRFFGPGGQFFCRVSGSESDSFVQLRPRAMPVLTEGQYRLSASDEETGGRIVSAAMINIKNDHD